MNVVHLREMTGPQPGGVIIAPTEIDKPSGCPAMQANAVGRWENEGGPELASPHSETRSTVAGEIGDAEEGNIRVRLIALENIVVALAAGASQTQHESIRDMTRYILPREGKTQHRLTIEAARNMVALVERADQFKKRAEAVSPVSTQTD